MAVKKKALILDFKQALDKMEAYCAYQERCEGEVREKLSELGVSIADADKIIDALIENNFLDESRFIYSYIRGKLRINQWGKLKIQQALRAKGIEDKRLREAFEAIDKDEYITILDKLTDKKWHSLSKLELQETRQKTVQYLLSRGFEYDLIAASVKKITNQTNEED